MARTLIGVCSNASYVTTAYNPAATSSCSKAQIPQQNLSDPWCLCVFVVFLFLRQTPAFRRAPQAGEDQFAHEDEFFRQPVVKTSEESFMGRDFFFPGVNINGHQLIEFLRFHVAQAVPHQIFESRHPTERALNAVTATMNSIHDPLQNAHVFAKPGPQEFSVCVLAEPVYTKDARRIGDNSADLKPVVKIIRHVVTAKRKHCHWISADFAHLACGGSSRFRPHGGCHIDSEIPIEGLHNERHQSAASAAKNKGADGNSVWIFPIGIDGRALARGSSEAGIGMRSDTAAFGSPWLALPVGESGWRRLGHSFPPDVAVRSQRYVGENAIGAQSCHRVRVGHF